MHHAFPSGFHFVFVPKPGVVVWHAASECIKDIIDSSSIPDACQLEYMDLTEKQNGEVGMLRIRNVDNWSCLKLHIGTQVPAETFQFLTLSQNPNNEDEGTPLHFESMMQRQTFYAVLRAIIAKLHKATGSVFTYSTSSYIISDNHIQNFEDAICVGVGSDYAIIRQSDRTIQPGIQINSLDAEMIEICQRDGIFGDVEPYTHRTYGGSVFDLTVRYDRFLANLYNALLGRDSS